jgi:hypothetical protein
MFIPAMSTGPTGDRPLGDPTVVLLVRDPLQVINRGAVPHVAEMIRFQAGRERSVVLDLPGDEMGLHCPASEVELAVSTNVPAGRPQATARRINFAQLGVKPHNVRRTHNDRLG